LRVIAIDDTRIHIKSWKLRAIVLS
jgi:hypothetical protein